MPHHPSEENAPSHIFDKVAKESSDSTASDHAIHKENEGPVKQATAEHHKSKGPQISENIPTEAPSKDELKAKAQELNK